MFMDYLQKFYATAIETSRSRSAKAQGLSRDVLMLPPYSRSRPIRNKALGHATLMGACGLASAWCFGQQ